MKTNAVLYVSYDGMTDSLGQSQVLPYLCGLSANYNIHLISFEKKERFAKYEQTFREICSKHQITWHPLFYTKNPPVFSTVYDVFKLFRFAKQLDRIEHFDLVHCRSYISALLGLSFKRKQNKKFLFDMRGFWADERVDGGVWNLKNPLFKFVYSYFKRKEKQFLQESDAVVSLTENGKNEMLKWNIADLTNDKISVIPCCVDLEKFNCGSIDESFKQQIRKKQGLTENDYVLGYVGSIGTWYMLPEMLDYFKALLLIKPNAKFFFVTSGSGDFIRQIASRKGINTENIIVDSCLHQHVASYISLFNHAVFFILPTFSKKASSPTKQGELMAMGIPVVCNSGVGDTDFVIHSFNSGALLTEFQEESYLQIAQKMIDNTFDKEMMIQGAQSFFGLQQGISNYQTIYKKVLQHD